METFELPGPETVPCEVCAGQASKPPCIKCGGAGVSRKMHTYAIDRRHKPSEGMPIAGAVMGLATKAGIEAKTAGRGIDEADFASATIVLMDGALASSILRFTTRDGAPIDIDVAYDGGNYHELYAALFRVGGYNGFFGPRAST